jgi:hypothetical protein
MAAFLTVEDSLQLAAGSFNLAGGDCWDGDGGFGSPKKFCQLFRGMI